MPSLPIFNILLSVFTPVDPTVTYLCVGWIWMLYCIWMLQTTSITPVSPFPLSFILFPINICSKPFNIHNSACARENSLPLL